MQIAPNNRVVTLLQQWVNNMISSNELACFDYEIANITTVLSLMQMLAFKNISHFNGTFDIESGEIIELYRGMLAIMTDNGRFNYVLFEEFKNNCTYIHFDIQLSELYILPEYIFNCERIEYF